MTLPHPQLRGLREQEPWLLDHLCARAVAEPEAISCSFLNRRGEVSVSLTAFDLVQGARTMAASLARAGVGPGDRVLCSLPTGPEFLFAFFGLQWLGAVPVPLPEAKRGLGKRHLEERIFHVIRDCSPKATIVEGESERALIQGSDADPADAADVPTVPIWTLAELLHDPSLDPALQAPLRPHTGEELAFLQYTSGSTDSPKGVMISHRALRANILGIAEGMDLRADDSSISWLPLYHDMGLIGGLLVALYTWSPAYLMPTLSFLARPALWLESISRYRTSISIATNFAYHLCAKHIDEARLAKLDLDLRHWRLAFCGAEPIRLDTLQAFQDKFASAGFSPLAFFPVYGMAEVALAATFPEPGAPLNIDRVRRHELLTTGRAEPPAPTEHEHRDLVTFVSPGRALPGHHVTIRTVDGNDALSERTLGEICLTGPSVYSGYYRPGSTPPVPHELRTGDLGYLAGGELFVVDRLQDLIKIGGATYFPTDVETVLDGVPGVRQGRIAALEIPDEPRGTGALAIVFEPEEQGENVDRLAIESEIRSRVETTFGIAPAVIELCARGSLPLTSSGKVQRHQARRMLIEARAGV